MPLKEVSRLNEVQKSAKHIFARDGYCKNTSFGLIFTLQSGGDCWNTKYNYYRILAERLLKRKGGDDLIR